MNLEAIADAFPPIAIVVVVFIIGILAGGAATRRSLWKRVEERLTFLEAQIVEALFALGPEPVAPPGEFTAEERHHIGRL